MVAGPRVCVVGQHELDYPRNIVNQRLMRAAGYEVSLCHSRGPTLLRTLSMIRQYLRAAPGAQLVFATEGSQRHIPWLKLAALWNGHAVAFDPFISHFNTEVEDRKLYGAWSYGGLRARCRDWLGCHSADFLVFDTAEHKDYFYRRYRLGEKPYRVLPVGVDEQVFRVRPAPPRSSQRRCEVLFYGTYIPLHGIDVILEAADRLRGDPALQFTLLGAGQELPRMRALAEQLALPNLRFAEPLAPAPLAEQIARADVCLGIFDTGIKAGQVVPNKIVQCAAMQKPIITRSSSAIERYFRDGESARLVPPGDAPALARALAELARDLPLRELLGRGARAVFEGEFSAAAQVQTMRSLLEEAAAARRGTMFRRSLRP
jgi:glycosyltransferase involved in cell wall biosynthesis